MWEIYSSNNEFIHNGVQTLPGIGPVRQKALLAANIETIADIILDFPAKYVYRKAAISLAECEDGEISTALVSVEKVNFHPHGRRGTIRVSVRDNSGRATLIFFTSPRWMAEKFRPGEELLVWGAVRIEDGIPVFQHPEFEFSSEGDEKIIPVYRNYKSLVEAKIGRRSRTKLVMEAFKNLGAIEDPIPEKMARELGLPTLEKSFRILHNPENWKKLELARRRLAFGELLLLQIVFSIRRRKAGLDKNAGPVESGKIFEAVKKSLPYRLTSGQIDALKSILEIFRSPGCSMLLLNGDVGSGKTVLAMLAASAAVDSGLQVVVIVPSLLVSRQHADLFADLTAQFGVSVGLLTGESCSPGLRERLRSGEVDIVIGTQALLSPKIKFKRLGLIIIDEQHRLGVRQRLALPERTGAHVLMLSATPIPRTAALAFYGDLEPIVLGEFPSQRAGSKSFLRECSARETVWDFIGERIDAGERIFVVHPKIKGKDHSAAEYGFCEFDTKYPGKVALLHGGMSAKDKNAIFQKFRSGTRPILATTSLVEIGLDVPEASVMLIEHAENFGLAQLHQLRGRIGRAKKRGYCILLTDKSRGSRNWKRLEKFCKTDNGFEIARLDLMERGEGELLSHAQAGRFDFKFADPMRMPELLDAARKLSENIISGDPELSLDKNIGFKRGIDYISKSKDIIQSAV